MRWFKRKSLIIPPNILKEAEEQLKFTPDGHFLEQIPRWLIFICGNEQQGHPWCRKLGKDAVYKCPAYTSGEYVLWKYEGLKVTFTVPLDETLKIYQNSPDWDLAGAPLKKVRGEIWEIGAETFYSLDQFYQNGIEFKRRRICVVAPYRYLMENSEGVKAVSERYEQLVPVWFYVGVQEYWDQLLDGMFKPVRLFRPEDDSIPVHYHFTKLEYE